ncbi:MAG: CAP domain-containing protein, partial [Gemmatimonadetes bacterium]|nr:CAP domain-containing protein [Gemmatimonadota bacterium]
PASTDDPTADERDFVEHINQLRTSLGLVPLVVDPELTEQARVWARTMQQAGDIFHTSHLDAGISADWQKLGENVRLVFAAKNITDSEQREVYRSEFIASDVLRRRSSDGIDFSLTLGGEIRF